MSENFALFSECSTYYGLKQGCSEVYWQEISLNTASLVTHTRSIPLSLSLVWNAVGASKPYVCITQLPSVKKQLNSWLLWLLQNVVLAALTSTLCSVSSCVSLTVYVFSFCFNHGALERNC